MRHECLVLVVLAVSFACSSKDVASPPAIKMTLGEQRTGEATYYDTANGDGACMFGPSPNDMNVAALNAPDYSNAAYCGACADVTGPSGTVRVRIIDECPECPSGNLDLS